LNALLVDRIGSGRAPLHPGRTGRGTVRCHDT
jgi:hypothetical protein